MAATPLQASVCIGNITPASDVILNLLVTTFQKVTRTGEIDFNTIFHLTQHSQHIFKRTIATVVISEIFYTPFYLLRLQILGLFCFPSHVSSAWWPRVASSGHLTWRNPRASPGPQHVDGTSARCVGEQVPMAPAPPQVEVKVTQVPRDRQAIPAEPGHWGVTAAPQNRCSNSCWAPPRLPSRPGGGGPGLAAQAGLHGGAALCAQRPLDHRHGHQKPLW